MTASLKEVYRATSQNGRWGLALVSEGIPPEDLRQPVQATITALGSAEGHDVFRLEPTDLPQWALIGDDLVPLAGATVVNAQSLQGGDSVTLLLLSERAIIKSYGYKRRRSTITYYEAGEAKAIPASVLLALGVLPEAPIPEPIPAPEPFDPAAMEPEARGALAKALAKALGRD